MTMRFPVLKAFSATFAYLARHAIDLLKALWLPAVLIVALQLYALPPLFSSLASMVALGEHPEPSEAAAVLGQIGKWTLILLAGSALLFPMMTVASLIHIVRGDERRAPFYFQYGGDELRVLAAYVIFSMMILLVSLVGGLAVAVLAFLVALVSRQPQEAAGGLGEFVVNIAIAWFRLRLCVLYPAAIATRTIGLGVAWNSTKGEVFRLLGFWILVGLIVLLLGALLLAPFAAGLVVLLVNLSEVGDDAAAARAAVVPVLEELGRLFSPEGPSGMLFAGALLLATISTTAITNIAAGTAWRYLTDREPRAAAAD